MYNGNRQRQNPEETHMTNKTIRIKTRLIKETLIKEGDCSERVIASIVVTTSNENDLAKLHDKIVEALLNTPVL